MFSRISGVFKREEKPKIDLKDLLIQVKNLSTEEKQLVRNALDEQVAPAPVLDPAPSQDLATTVTSAVTDAQMTEAQSTQVTSPVSSGAVYEYKPETYKKRGD